MHLRHLQKNKLQNLLKAAHSKNNCIYLLQHLRRYCNTLSDHWEKSASPVSSCENLWHASGFEPGEAVSADAHLCSAAGGPAERQTEVLVSVRRKLHWIMISHYGGVTPLALPPRCHTADCRSRRGHRGTEPGRSTGAVWDWRRLITSPVGALWEPVGPCRKPQRAVLPAITGCWSPMRPHFHPPFWVLWTIGCISFPPRLFSRWWTAGSYFEVNGGREGGRSHMLGHFQHYRHNTNRSQCFHADKKLYFFLLTYKTHAGLWS